MNITKIPASSKSYGSKRSLSDVKYIVIHYTGNDGDTAENNGNYFKNGNTRSAGAHYFISQNGSVVESVDPTLTAWAVGGVYEKGAPYYGKCTNANSVSIELCDNASKAPSEKQTKSCKELVSYIKKKCPNAKTIVRHKDVNGKSCPGPYLLNNSNWETFKKQISGGLVATTTTETKTSKSTTKTSALKVTAKSGLNVRSGAGTNYSKVIAIPYGKTVEWVDKETKKVGSDTWYKVKYGGKTGWSISKYLKQV